MADAKPKVVRSPIALPSDRAWLDPRLITANIYPRTTDFTMVGGTMLAVLPLNPDRWAVGWTIHPNLGSTYNVGVWGDLNSSFGWTTAATAVVWFEQLKFGPLVGMPWFAFSSFGGPARVIELIRQP